MRHVLVFLLVLLMGLPGAWAADRPTRDDVMALTRDAARQVAEQGVDAARRQFHAEGRFRFGEVYVNVIDENGTWLIYPPNPRNEGKSVLNVRDADGRLVVQDILTLARDKGEGWVSYRWLNPANNRIEYKDSFVVRVSGAAQIVYIGLYRSTP